jgi:putative flippase GtrA
MKHTRASKFLLSGGLAAVVEYLLFTAFMYFQILPLVGAQTVSFLAGLIVSYSLNRKWVFKSENDIKKEGLKYLTLAIINLVLTNIILALLINILGVIYWIAKILVMGGVAAWNYIIFQKFIFGSERK